MKIFKRLPFIATAAAGLLLFSGIASAHVTVKPASSQPGAWETYTIKIPSEKEIATTKVTLKVPEGVELMQYQPIPDWKITTEKDSAGKISSITWNATAEGINAGEFQQFNFVAHNPEKETDVAWNAFQYYKDGSIVEWTGDEGSESPHSITKITTVAGQEAESSGHSHDAAADHQDQTTDKSSSADTASAAADSSSSSGVQTATLVVSIAALVLSIISLFAALAKRKR
ncbi:DUF1775 domain-containing protein [Paenibacillus dokdonensis]|uniref:DUF1775 domain-containing protein n=1 Tax=Paenibacillus dokdonensis TaxID=2567944 RepID=A0ABU6GP71_9BACL|nr:DUF1775 domain-containing protein [Paenibacillus dokdonensis]MEC0241043.1 DUF1775 domain-containing protein [Paenibacillus dokdonensis]